MAVTTFHEDAAGTAGGQDPGVRRSAAAAEALLLEVVGEHADELLRIARRHSLCADDAHDAYQRSLEQFLRHGRRLRRETAVGWLFTVCKREAQAVRRARGELVGTHGFEADDLEARHVASPEDRAVAAEAVTRSAEALRALKPQELRALWLRADGRSYAEIQAATGWSYTKVNRCLTEGRRRFLARCAALEAGADCDRWHGALAALAAGEAGAEELAALRRHLRGCGACRATLRGLHASSASVATVLPPGLLLAGAAASHGTTGRVEAAGSWLSRLAEAVAGQLHERAAAGAVQWQAAMEAATGGKVAAVAASTVALAGGGVAVVQPAAPREPQAGTGATDAARGTTRAAAPARRAAALPVGTVARRAAGTARTTADGEGAVPAAARAGGAAPVRRVAGAPGAREFGVDAGAVAAGARASPSARPVAVDRREFRDAPSDRDAGEAPSGAGGVVARAARASDAGAPTASAATAAPAAAGTEWGSPTAPAAARPAGVATSVRPSGGSGTATAEFGP